MVQYIKNIIIRLINFIELFEFKYAFSRYKVVESIGVGGDGLFVDTDTGSVRISHLHNTRQYIIYSIKTRDGFALDCADEHILFTEDFEQIYVKDLKIGEKIITKNGISEISSISYNNIPISMYDVSMMDENHRLYTNGILSHNTTMSTIFLTWFALFNHTKNMLVLANKGETMTEILNKIKEIYINLPYFLQCGVQRWGETFIKFENKCRIFGQATTKSPGVGFTIHLLYIDEFAHIHKNIIEPFYENILPVLSSPEIAGVARFIITSTSNGMNKFSELYTDAEMGRNSFHPIRVDWWEVEGRDEEWKAKTIADSSEESFNRQFGNQFISESNLLMNNPKIPKTWKRFCKDFVRKDLSQSLVDLPEELQKHFYWHPDFDVDDLQTGYFVISLDFADGEGGDYNIINIFQLQTLSDVKMRKGNKKFSLKDYIRLVQVGYFRDNYTTMPNFTLVFSEFIYNCVNLENVKVVFEVNDNRYLMMYSDLIRNRQYYEGFLYRSFHTEKARQKKIGLKLSTQSRHSNFINFKGYLVESNIVITDKITAIEMMNFCVSKNGTYQSMGSNDDLAMSSFNISNFFDDDDYSGLIEDYISELGPSFEIRVMNMIDRNIDELGDNEVDVSDIIKDLDF